MITASLILILSTALLFFYFQATCQKILKREFEQEYFRRIVNANRLEFLAVRKALEEIDARADYPRLCTMLNCDFLALAYLLKYASNLKQRHSLEERLVILYCRLAFLSSHLRGWLRLGEKPAILQLTVILQYFSNVVGERVSKLRFDLLTSADLLRSV